MIRVGRCTYNGGNRTDPSFEGFTPILVLTKSSPYGSIGPYCLKDNTGKNMENLYQFSKVYETVPETICKYSRYDDRVIWKWKAERHVNICSDGTFDILPEYFKWREAGMKAKDAIRYPVGFNHRGKCLFALKQDNGVIVPKRLNYIESRKEIYYPIYRDLVRKEEQFLELKQRLANKENLLILEVDGPHTESLPYYKEKYNVNDNFIIGNTMLATKENLDIMLNDPLHPYGHGYCLAAVLLDNS
jgi:hypothetical protein